jgi:uncharacterized protein (TIGR02996 family)
VNEEETFLAAIRANPADSVTRLVYADWLQERDRPEARYLRLEVQLAKCGPKAQKFAAVYRRGLQELRCQLDPRWVAFFEQPGVLRANLSPYPASWLGPDLRPLRTGPDRPGEYAYESLPPIPNDLHERDWDWLLEPNVPRPAVTRNVLDVRALEWVTERAQKAGIQLPSVFVALFTGGAAQQLLVRTGSRFAPTQGISPCPRQPGAHVIPFVCGGNYWRWWWSLFVAPSGYHCVVVSPPFHGNGRRVPSPNPDSTRFCAPSLETFVYRFWIEHEIGYRLRPQFPSPDPDAPPAPALLAELQAYLNHYRTLTERPT